ncbi:MAG: DUF748 domain-containing protein [Geothrix sp.]|uniref:DUF748 domain-containing protein n=1 Tax=Geothrix sp. TaxID=1962974 RepID=UPI003BB17F91
MLAGVLLVALVFVDALLAGPMRAWAERTMNANLNGYTVRIAKVRPHLWRLAFDLDNLVLVQNTHPEPPVADFGALEFSLVWSELLRFKVAGTLTIQRPALHINLDQIEEEAQSHVSLKDRGWQKAVESIFPIKLDQVKVVDGSLLYLSSGTATKPLRLTKVSMLAKNVRNIAAAKGTYPSPVSLDGVLFETGTISFKGAADFLREPYVGARGDLRLDKIPLDRLNPLAQEYQLKTTGGFLSLHGALEYTPEAQMAHLEEVLLDQLKVDYVTSKATKAVERIHGKQAIKLAKQVRNAPQLLLKVDTLNLTHSQLGFVNEGVSPSYRLFMADMNLTLKNLSNQREPGKTEFRAQGTFMGSGTTVLSGAFRSTATPADATVQLKLDDARLVDLNGMLRTHADVDVAAGLFSVYTEMTVKNGRVEGYIKPLIKNLRIYDRQKDQGKPFGKRVKMHVLQFFAGLFKNHDSKAVATVIRISGSTHDPQTSEWEIIRKLIGNGLSRAILPGFLTGPKLPEPPKPPESLKPVRR